MTAFWLFACSVCFGDPASPLSKGLAAGVLFLLGVVLVMLTSIASIALTWSRRARRLEASKSQC